MRFSKANWVEEELTVIVFFTNKIALTYCQGNL
jgi:hypothetical protein